MRVNNGQYFKVLIVDDDEYSLQNLALSLKDKNFVVDKAFDANEAIQKMDESYYDFAIVDIKLPGKNGLHVVEYAKSLSLTTKFILITGFTDESAVIRAVKLNVSDILKKPYEETELHNCISKVINLIYLEDETSRYKERIAAENKLLKDELLNSRNGKNKADTIIIGNSQVIKKVINLTNIVSQNGYDCIMYGEKGTGKEMFAKHIHKTGLRKDKPFITMNCATISSGAFESELFGIESDGVNGLKISKPGLLETATGGILFLDGITEMPLAIQEKLLLSLEERSFVRIGGRKIINVDIQLLIATNSDPQEAIKNKKLLRGLFQRFNDNIIYLPPLKERENDIELLYRYFKEKYEAEYNIKAPELLPSHLEKLSLEKWEGNVRQLSNFIKKWCLYGSDSNLDEILALSKYNSDVDKDDWSFTFQEGTIKEVEEAKFWIISKILRKFKGNKSKSARHLGLSYPGLLKILKQMEKRSEIKI